MIKYFSSRVIIKIKLSLVNIFFNILKINLLSFLLCLTLLTNYSYSDQTTVHNGLIMTSDQVEFNENLQSINANGNVTIYFDNKILTADSIQYYKKQEKLIVQGVIKVKFNNDIITLADSAELSDDLRSGIIFAANTLINNTFQLRSKKVVKLRNGSSEFYEAITSSCQVCTKQTSPIWDISASKIVHNRKEKLLIFTNAKLSIFGFPIFYTPYLSTPEPGTVRASGFLPPSISYSSSTGLGYIQPYYHVINSYSDTTFATEVTNEGINGISLEYRERFRAGNLSTFFEFDPSENSRKFFKTSKVSLKSKLHEGNTELSLLGFVVPSKNENKNESFVRIKSLTKLAKDTNLSTEIINNTDRDLLSTYGYNSTDKLVSNIKLTKIEPEVFQEGRLSLFTSLRDEDISGKEPQAVPEIFWSKYGNTKIYGASYGLEMSLINLIRKNGRDVLRVSSSLDLQNNLYFPYGIKSHNTFYLRGSAYKIRDDDSFDEKDVFSIRPLISSDFTLPMIYKSQSLRNTLTPRMQIVYSEASKLYQIPNEDSDNINFDETNIFSLNRFPGIDLAETGLRLNAGLEFQSEVSQSFSYAFSIGEIFRHKPSTQFSASSGIDGYRSDIVLSSRASFKRNYPNIDLSTKLLLDQNMALKLNETSVVWSEKNYTNTGSFVYLVKDADEDRPEDQAYLNFGTTFNIGENWKTSLSLNRDFINDYFSSFSFESDLSISKNWAGRVLADKQFSETSTDSSRSGFGLTYQNECIQIDLTYTDLINKPDTKKEFLFSFSTPLFSLGKVPANSTSGLSFKESNFNPSSSVCARIN